MSEQQLLAFRGRAEELVDLPDLGGLERRGAARRRNRRIAAATIAAAAVAAAAWASAGLGSPRAEPPDPAQQRLAQATEFIGSFTEPELEPGTYYLKLSPELDRPVLVLDLGPGWRSWTFGPDRGSKREGFATIVAADLYTIVEDACEPGEDGMRELSGDPDELVRALVALPRYDVVQGPEPDYRFGHPATHLHLSGRNLGCPFGTPLAISTDTGTGQTLGTNVLEPEMDVWVIDVGDRATALFASWTPGGDPAHRAALRDALDSVDIVVPEQEH